jgi:hypothetical protein
MATFRELASDHYSALVAYERYLDLGARGFLNHVAREPDRDLSAKQADWTIELVARADIHWRIERGECALPPTLDGDDDEGDGSPEPSSFEEDFGLR